MSDILGNAPELPEHAVADPRRRFFSDPLTLALIAFPLSLLVIQGSQIFRGVNYTPFAVLGNGSRFGSNGSVGGPDNTCFVAAAFRSAAFSLVPVLCGGRGLSRVQTMLLTDRPELHRGEPRPLRYRLLHVAARITQGQRRVFLRLAEPWPWPWALALARAFTQPRAISLSV